MEIKGTITRIYDIQKGVSKNGKEWMKRDFVIDNGEKYNSTLCLTLFGDEKVEQLTQSSGDEVVVQFNLSSREYNDKWYTQAQAWKIESKTTEQEKDNFISSLNEDVPF